MTTFNALSLAVILVLSPCTVYHNTITKDLPPTAEAADRMARLELMHASGLIAQSAIDEQRQADAARR